MRIFCFQQSITAECFGEGKQQCFIYGRWEEGARSISSSIPISAFVNDGVLSIHSSTQRSDITICILKDGKVLYEKMIPASKTDCVTIDLSEFEPGTYTVGLKNQWDDCLWGEFYANYDKKWSYDQNCIGC